MVGGGKKSKGKKTQARDWRSRWTCQSRHWWPSSLNSLRARNKNEWSMYPSRKLSSTGAHMQNRLRAIWCVRRRRLAPAAVGQPSSSESRQRAKSCTERASSWDYAPKLHHQRSSRTKSKKTESDRQTETKEPCSEGTANSQPASSRHDDDGGAHPGDVHWSHAKQGVDKEYTTRDAEVGNSHCHTWPPTMHRSSSQRRYGRGASDYSTERPSWRWHSNPWAHRSSQRRQLQPLPLLRLPLQLGPESCDER